MPEGGRGIMQPKLVSSRNASSIFISYKRISEWGSCHTLTKSESAQG